MAQKFVSFAVETELGDDEIILEVFRSNVGIVHECRVRSVPFVCANTDCPCKQVAGKRENQS